MLPTFGAQLAEDIAARLLFAGLRDLNLACTGKPISNRTAFMDVRWRSWWYQVGGKYGSRHAHRVGVTGQQPHEFRPSGQVGQESNLQPAVLETQSDVSGGVAWCRHMPVCRTPCVAECR